MGITGGQISLAQISMQGAVAAEVLGTVDGSVAAWLAAAAGGSWVKVAQVALAGGTAVDFGAVSAATYFVIVYNYSPDSNAAGILKLLLNSLAGTAYRYSHINEAGTTSVVTGNPWMEVQAQNAHTATGMIIIGGETQGWGEHRLPVGHFGAAGNTDDLMTRAWVDVATAQAVSDIELIVSPAATGTFTLYAVTP